MKPALLLPITLVSILAIACTTSAPTPTPAPIPTLASTSAPSPEPTVTATPPVEKTSPEQSQSFYIPPIMTGTRVNGKMTYDLVMQSGITEFLPGKQTATLGYNGNYLGPTLVMNQGDEVVLNVTNNLGGPPTTTHWHGFHLPAIMDGGPHQEISDGETWSPTFTILNRASTYWYHPHPHPVDDKQLNPDGTSGQVFRGLAGMIIVRDEESQRLDLPKQYGVDDIPLIIQDRSFNDDGSFLEFPIRAIHPRLPDAGPVVFPFRKGDNFLVNGVISPVFETHAQIIRFRILNASNNRFYNLGFSDNRTFYQIASGGGLLEEPVPLERLIIAPAERMEILVDFGNDENSRVRLKSYNSELGTTYTSNPLAPVFDEYDSSDFDIFTIAVGAPNANPVTTLLQSLTKVERIPAEEAINADRPRPFELSPGRLETTPVGDPPTLDVTFTINGRAFDVDRIDEVIRLGDTEIWEITNTTGLAHPIHIHGDSFQILSRNGSLNNVPANERGWKDTVIVKPGESVRIIKRFEDFSDPDGPYMFHCHILDHEDGGMMLQWIVVEPGSPALSRESTPQPTSKPAETTGMTVSTDIAGFKLEDLVIPVGTEVTWVNQDSVSHTTTSGTPAELSDIWNSDFLGEGDSFSRVFLEPGVYPYFCRIHPSMTATITVMQPRR